MNRRIKTICGAIGMLAVASITQAARPNVVIIYGDDVGYGDVGAYGATMIPTPNIDQLAAEGLRFTDGHCSASTCTPSRYSMLTGRHAFRTGTSVLPPNAPLCIPTDILTLPKLFRQAGYATGVIGKWHLGLGEKKVPTDWNGDVTPGPLEIGFDSSLLLPSTNDRVPCVYLRGHQVVGLDPADPLYVGMKYDEVDKPGSTVYPDGRKNSAAMTYYMNSGKEHNQSVINGIGRIGYMSGGKSALWNDETIATTFVDEAKTYIAEHKDKPFLLYYAAQNVHVPRAPHPRFQGTTKLGYRGDSMVEFDWATGEILAALKKHGLTDNTLVIFSSDNGPTYNDGYRDGSKVGRSSGEVDRGHDGSGIWRGGKYQIYEGGTRVPFIVKWPGRVQPGVSSALISQIGFVAAFAEMFDIPLPADEALDSRSVLAALLGDDREGLPFLIEESRGKRALRVQDWKYIMGPGRHGEVEDPELYNLGADPSEQRNVLAEHPEKAAVMATQLQSLIAAEGVRAR